MNEAEEERLYLQGGVFRYGLKPVPGTALDSLNQRHLRDYFGRVLGGSVPPTDDVDQWQRLLQNLELATQSSGHLAATIDDYGYVDARGMGIRNKIIPGMLAHNGTEPDLIAEEYRFTVRLWKEPKPS